MSNKVHPEKMDSSEESQSEAQKKAEKKDPKIMGRPMKYVFLFDLLEDDQLYQPASFGDLADEQGAWDHLSPGDQKKQRVRLRHTMARFQSNHNFPQEGDGTLKRRGQAPMPAWLGSRWKAAVAAKKERKPKVE